MLEGEAEKQESQETGESDSSCGKSEKLVCLGLKETTWDMWPENLPLAVSSTSPRTRVGEDERCIAADQGAGGELMVGGQRGFCWMKNLLVSSLMTNLTLRAISKTEKSAFSLY